jgi:hypothetical protein
MILLIQLHNVKQRWGKNALIFYHLERAMFCLLAKIFTGSPISKTWQQN